MEDYVPLSLIHGHRIIQARITYNQFLCSLRFGWKKDYSIRYIWGGGSIVPYVDNYYRIWILIHRSTIKIFAIGSHYSLCLDGQTLDQWGNLLIYPSLYLDRQILDQWGNLLIYPSLYLDSQILDQWGNLLIYPSLCLDGQILDQWGNLLRIRSTRYHDFTKIDWLID